MNSDWRSFNHMNRKSNIELFRIFSMILIVISHVTWEGYFNFDKDLILKNTSIQSLWMLGQIGVVGFTLISSYFLSTKEDIKKESILKLSKETWSYSLIILIISAIFARELIGLKIIIKSIFPIIFGTYWYVTAYLALYLISPYLNMVIRDLSKDQYRKLLAILIVVFTILPTFTRVSALNSPSNGATTFSLIIIYFIGGYIRKYEEDFSKNNIKKYILLLIFSVGSLFVLSLILNVAYKMNLVDINIRNHFGAFMRTNSPFEILAGTSLFLIFKNLDLKYSKLVNNIAKSMISVYIIHTNPIVMEIIWNKIVRIKQYYMNPFIILIEIGVGLSIFAVCTLIDQLRLFMVSFILKREK